MIIPDKEGFSIREAARLLGVGHMTIHRAVAARRIRTVSVACGALGDRISRVIPRDEIVRIASQKVKE